MNIAGIKHNDIANGIGVRTTVFVSGCRRHCKGCHNPEAWDFHYGKPFTEELQREIIDSLKPAWIQGLTVCGGEPFEQENEKALTTFLRRVRDKLPGKGWHQNHSHDNRQRHQDRCDHCLERDQNNRHHGGQRHAENADLIRFRHESV